MPKVKLSNGTVLNFPDEMSQDEIKSVIQKKFPQPNQSENNIPEQSSLINQPSESQEPQQEKSFWQRYQDFMSPESKVDSEGKPMVETFLGRMPQSVPQFKIGTPQNEELVKNMIEGAAGAPGVKTVVQAPMKFSLKNIAKRIIEERNKEKLFHTTQYNRLWDAARKAGIKEVKFNPEEINLKGLIENRANSKYIRPLERFIKNPTLQNAQTAQSDLGKLINSPQLSKEVLGSEEQAVKNYASKAQQHIRDMMFRNEKGEVNQGLKNTYDKITSSYEKNVIPYKDKYITKFAKGKMTEEQLIPKLKEREFMATKGKVHSELGNRDSAIKIMKYLGIPFSAGLGIGAAELLGAKDLINKLLGRSND